MEDLDGDELPPVDSQAATQGGRYPPGLDPPGITPGGATDPTPSVQNDSPDVDVETPVFSPRKSAPCYVADRSGHEAYADTAFSRYLRRERRKRDTQIDED